MIPKFKKNSEGSWLAYRRKERIILIDINVKPKKANFPHTREEGKRCQRLRRGWNTKLAGVTPRTEIKLNTD